MGQLTVTFSGVCTHFSKVVPGVAHRVVLPNASNFHFGIVRMPPTGSMVGYYIQPHYAVLKTTSTLGNPLPSVDNAMSNGTIFAGASLKIPNATGDLSYDPTYFQSVKSLSDFVPAFTPSQDVVFSGRAACYFDFGNGLVQPSPASGGAMGVAVTVQTNGRPQLTVTPFETGVPVDISSFLEVNDDHAEITVANLEVDPDPAIEDVPFDYMLNYLTSQTGIPPMLTAQTPGMDNFQQITKAMLVDALNGLADFIAAPVEAKFGPTAAQIIEFNFSLVDPSCSDSRYP